MRDKSLAALSCIKATQSEKIDFHRFLPLAGHIATRGSSASACLAVQSGSVDHGEAKIINPQRAATVPVITAVLASWVIALVAGEGSAAIDMWAVSDEPEPVADTPL